MIRLKYFRAFILFVAGIIAVPGPSLAQDASISYGHAGRPPTAPELMKWHEILTYEVHYSFFTLGEVRVDVVKDTLDSKGNRWHLQSVITSNSSVPFVGHEKNVYNTNFMLKDGAFLVQQFWTDNLDENEYNTSRYTFDRKKGAVYAYDKEKARTDTLALEEPASSGHIIFLMNRLYAGTDSTLKVPIYLSDEKKYMTFENSTKTEIRSYDAFPQKVKTFHSRGHTDIDGPFGFSGRFEAWYLADDLRVPVEARVKVWIGHAKVKLIEYKKELRK